MRKKLTSQGAKGRESFTITLPKEWVRAEKLDEAKEVNLEVAGNKIIIAPDRKNQETIVVDANKYNHSFDKILAATYRLGVSQVTFTHLKDEYVEKIHNILQTKFIGFEVVEQTGEKMTVKYIMKESEEEFKTILRRIFLLIIELAGNASGIQVKTLEKNIQRLTNYCRRILVTKGHLEFLKVPLYYLLIDQLDKLNDELAEMPLGNLTQKQAAVRKKVHALLEELYNQFYRFNKDKYDEFNQKSFELIKTIRLEKTVEISLMHMHNAARIINSMYGTVFALNYEQSA